LTTFSAVATGPCKTNPLPPPPPIAPPPPPAAWVAVELAQQSRVLGLEYGQYSQLGAGPLISVFFPNLTVGS